MSTARLPHRIWLAALFAASAIFLGAAWMFLVAPLDDVLGIVPDDAFYYLEIARNLADMGRSTADGVSNTNGYHPLWMLVVTGLAWLNPGDGPLLRAAMTASLVLHVGTTAAMSWSLQPIVGRRWAATAAACWLVNPLAFLIAQQTVEGAAYAIALLVVFRLYTTIGDRAPGDLPLRSVAGFGAALAVMCLARTEGSIVALLAFPWLLMHLAGPAGRLGAAITRVAAAAAVFVAVALPWLWFSWQQVGTVVQDSGAMKALWAAEINHTPYEWLRNAVFTAVYIIRYGFRLMTGLDVPMELLIVLCLLLFGGAASVHAGDASGRHARALRAVMISVIGTWLVYGLRLTAPQLWWLMLPCLSLVLLIFLATPPLCERWRLSSQAQAWLQTGSIVASLTAFVLLRLPTAPLYPWQVDVRTSQAAIEALVPAPARIGSFNAGIPLFFGSARVVALDGLVNHDARVAWHEHRFDEFLRGFKVEYIADEQIALDHGLRFVRRAPRLERVASYPLTGWATPERILWRVTWPE